MRHHIVKVRPAYLFLLALALRFLAVGLRPVTPIVTENLRVAETLSSQGFLGNPFSMPTGPTAHLAPVYPVIAAAAFRLFADRAAAILALQLFCGLIAAVNVMLLLALARTLRLSRAEGLVAAGIWVFPFYTWIELSAEHETVLTVTAALLSLTLATRLLQRDTLTPVIGVALGVVAAVSAYFSPLLLPMLFFPGLLALGKRKGLSMPSLGFFAAIIVAFAFVLSPYTIRNYRALGGLVLMRDNLGLELSVSNASNAHPIADENFEPGASMSDHPFVSPVEATQLNRVGELAYNRARMRRALTWIRSHPSAFASLSAQRLVYAILPYSHRLRQRVVAGAIVLLACFGYRIMWREGRRAAAVTLIAALCGYQLIYLFIQIDIRYVYLPLWLQSLAASVALVHFIGWLRDRQRPSPAFAQSTF